MKKGENMIIEESMEAKVAEAKTGDSRAREEENAAGVWKSGNVWLCWWEKRQDPGSDQRQDSGK